MYASKLRRNVYTQNCKLMACVKMTKPVSDLYAENLLVKFGYSEKATKFEKIFHLKFDAVHTSKLKWEIFF